MGFIIGCVVFGGLVGSVYWFGRWILGPIDRAAKGRRAPARISVGDFLCLFIAIQLPFTCATRMRSEETETYFWLFVALSWIVAPVIWLSCALSLSRAGITGGKHRLIFMGLVLPVVYYGLASFIFLEIFAIALLTDGDGKEVIRHGWLIAAWLCTGGALIGCGLYTNWLVRAIGVEKDVRSDTPALPASRDGLAQRSESIPSAS